MRTTSRLLAILLALALSLVVAACGDDEEESGGGAPQAQQPQATPEGGAIRRNPQNADVSLTIGSKNFTEQQVLGQIYAQGLEAAGYTIDTDLNLGDQNTALRAVKRGTVDAYPEYTGTALLSFFDVQSDELPDDPQQAYQEARAGFAEEGLEAFPPTPFTSSNEVAVTRETAQRLNLRRISDLRGKEDDLTLYGSPECRQRLDCLLGLRQVYGLRFGRFVPVALEQRHQVLTSGRADVSIVFTTDPQIRRERFVLLEDDRNMFPPYNSTLVVREQVADQAGPDFRRTIELLQRDLTDEAMQELNARVDLDRKTPEQVASEYLRETRLVAEG
jgi:osmoprotectant transport system substrate-binding protein